MSSALRWLLVAIVLAGGVGCEPASNQPKQPANAVPIPPPPLTDRQRLDQLQLIVGEWDLASFDSGDDPAATRLDAPDLFQSVRFQADGTFHATTLLAFLDPMDAPGTLDDLAPYTHAGAARRLVRDAIGHSVETVGLWTAVLDGGRLRIHFRYPDQPDVTLDAVLLVPPRAEGRYVLRTAGNPVLTATGTTEFARYE